MNDAKAPIVYISDELRAVQASGERFALARVIALECNVRVRSSAEVVDADADHASAQADRRA
ncbi:MAG: hypothetical protein AAF726_13635 [Planctomycetota bacterium]